jgi:hypothetical protein
MNHSFKLRKGNRALKYAQSQFIDAKVQKAIESIPELADGLYYYARGSARALLKSNTTTARSAVRSVAGLFFGPTKETELANSIFDLQLTAVFSILSNDLGNDIASVLVDALLYQATGCEAAALPDGEPPLFLLGCEKVRGIHKYHVARQKMPHIGDIEAWTFGKEFGSIVYGNPMDIAHIMSVSALAFAARVRAQWSVKFVLHGTKPTKEDEEKLRACLEGHDKNLEKMADALSKIPAE